jgi:hypothetical protein
MISEYSDYNPGIAHSIIKEGQETQDSLVIQIAYLLMCKRFGNSYTKLFLWCLNRRSMAFVIAL